MIPLGKLFQRKRFRNKWFKDKKKKSLHMTKFLVTCNNPRIASTKTQSNFCNNVSFAKDKIQKDEHFMISKLRYLSFLETKICFKTLKLWKTTQRSWNFMENCQERGDRSLISHPSLLKIRVEAFSNSSFSNFFHNGELKSFTQKSQGKR